MKQIESPNEDERNDLNTSITTLTTNRPNSMG